MREAAFAEFHQVCHVVSLAFWFCFLPLFRILRGYCCLIMQGGGGTCSIDIIVLKAKGQ